MTDRESQREAALLALDPQHFPTLENARQVLEPGEKHPANPVLAPRPGQWDGTRYDYTKGKVRCLMVPQGGY